jgi:hypothetical protein
MNDLRQTKMYGDFLSKIGWQVIEYKKRQYFIKKIPIIGSAIKLQRCTNFQLKDVDFLCKKFRVFQVIIEPVSVTQKSRSLLGREDYKLSNTPYLPTKTLQIDISHSIRKIYDQMKKDARYSIRKSEEIPIYESQDIETFRKAWKQSVGLKRHVLPLYELQAFKDAFGERMVTIMNSSQTSGAMFLVADHICYYWVGFTDDLARKTLVQYKVLWSGIQWAKKQKAVLFDFEGIYDERFPNEDWKGFTHFKKSFGGVEIEYPGCFTKWRIPL